jgi:hypothetical protein
VSFRAWPTPKVQVGKATLNVKGMNISLEQAMVMIKAYNPEIEAGVTLSKAVFIKAKNTGDPLMEIALSDDAAAKLGTREPRWKLNLGMEQRRVQYYGKTELVQRLHESKHPLAEMFRTLALQQEHQEEEDLSETAEDRRLLAAETAAGGGPEENPMEFDSFSPDTN